MRKIWADNVAKAIVFLMILFLCCCSVSAIDDASLETVSSELQDEPAVGSLDSRYDYVHAVETVDSNHAFSGVVDASVEDSNLSSEASGDKFSSVAPRIAAQAAIKIAEATAKSYVQQAISNISQIAGVDLTAVYDMGMQVYDAAVADRNDVPKPKDDGGGEKTSPPASGGSGGTGGTDPTKKQPTSQA